MIDSKTLGKIKRKIEVTNISANGIWILTDDKELFIPYKDFPWFKEASVDKILNVEEPFPSHFYWPDLDIDLSVDIITNPDLFPLKMH
jgi:hypothetical protein